MQINTTSDALDNLNKKLGGADIEIEPSTNKVDALKKIYKTLGGTDDVKGLSTVYQVLEKITEVAEGGGGIRRITITGDTLDITPHQLIDALSKGNLVALFEVVDNDPIETNNKAFISIVTTLFYTGEVWRMFMTDPEEGGMYYRESSGYDEPFHQ